MTFPVGTALALVCASSGGSTRHRVYFFAALASVAAATAPRDSVKQVSKSLLSLFTQRAAPRVDICEYARRTKHMEIPLVIAQLDIIVGSRAANAAAVLTVAGRWRLAGSGGRRNGLYNATGHLILEASGDIFTPSSRFIK